MYLDGNGTFRVGKGIWVARVFLGFRVGEFRGCGQSIIDIHRDIYTHK